jgi:hypothetical protein
LTLPQIELMQADLPHTLFKKNSRNKNDGKVIVDDEAIRLNMEEMRKAEARRRRREKGYTVDEVFAGLADDD